VYIKFPAGPTGFGTNAGVSFGHSRGDLTSINNGFPI